MTEEELDIDGINMDRVAKNLNRVQPIGDMSEIANELSFPRRPPPVPKKEKSVSFP